MRRRIDDLNRLDEITDQDDRERYAALAAPGASPMSPVSRLDDNDISSICHDAASCGELHLTVLCERALAGDADARRMVELDSAHQWERPGSDEVDAIEAEMDAIGRRRPDLDGRRACYAEARAAIVRGDA
jgi:hypothetical protein